MAGPSPVYGLGIALPPAPGFYGMPLVRSNAWTNRILPLAPKLWWRFNETAGTTFSDNMLNSTLTLAGSGTTLAVAGGTRDGAGDLGVLFNGSGWATGNPAVMPTGSSNRTIAMFLKWTSTTGAITPFSYGSSSTLAMCNVILNNGSTGAIGYNGFNSNFNASGAYNDGKWHLVMLTYDGSFVTFYIDDPVTSKGAGGAALNTGTATLGVGRDQVQATFNYPGSIDELMVWSRVLSAAERAIVFRGFVPF